MKKQYFKNLLWGVLLLAGGLMSSCSNEDSKEETATSGSRIITMKIGQSFNEQARGGIAKPDTIYQKLDNGMEMTAIVEQDGVGDSRATTKELVEPGTVVYAIVMDENKKILKKSYITVDANNELSISAPASEDVQVLLYSNNNTSSPSSYGFPGNGSYLDDDYQILAGGFTTKDEMFAHTGIIPAGTTNLGTVVFKHALSQVRVSLSYEGGITDFDALTNLISNGSANINVYTLELERGGGLVGVANIGKSDSPVQVLESPYWNFIPRNDGEPIEFRFIRLNDVPIDPIKPVYITTPFLPGCRYTIHLRVKKRKLSSRRKCLDQRYLNERFFIY
ncbi:MAG: hypothetical protein LUI85_17675 [Bacteroides sp.]|nr:hypothetical protein [Bacteroides sp.]